MLKGYQLTKIFVMEKTENHNFLAWFLFENSQKTLKMPVYKILIWKVLDKIVQTFQNLCSIFSIVLFSILINFDIWYLKISRFWCFLTAIFGSFPIKTTLKNFEFWIFTEQISLWRISRTHFSWDNFFYLLARAQSTCVLCILIICFFIEAKFVKVFPQESQIKEWLDNSPWSLL